MKRKIFFVECYACWASTKYPDIGKCKKQKLPRKKKKQLKRFLLLLDNLQYRGYMDHPTSCNLVEEYNRQKKIFHLEPFFRRNSDAIKLIRSYGDYAGESIYIDESGRLSWYWESDDDFTGGSSGIMPFCYNEKDAGQTWAFSEVKSLVRWLRDEYPFTSAEFPPEIVDDASLLRFAKKYVSHERN